MFYNIINVTKNDVIAKVCIFCYTLFALTLTGCTGNGRSDGNAGKAADKREKQLQVQKKTILFFLGIVLQRVWE